MKLKCDFGNFVATHWQPYSGQNVNKHSEIEQLIERHWNKERKNKRQSKENSNSWLQTIIAKKENIAENHQENDEFLAANVSIVILQNG